ncbi:hypothetical protein ABKV19_006660 [Rosa sericea]
MTCAVVTGERAIRTQNLVNADLYEQYFHDKYVPVCAPLCSDISPLKRRIRIAGHYDNLKIQGKLRK